MPSATGTVDAGQTARLKGRPLLCSHPGAERHGRRDGCGGVPEKVPVNTRVQPAVTEPPKWPNGGPSAFSPLSIECGRSDRARNHYGLAGLFVDAEFFVARQGNSRRGLARRDHLRELEPLGTI